MVTLTCKCGKNTLTFQHLGPSDFPQGLVQNCCEKAQVEAQVVTLDEVMAQLPVTTALPDLTEEDVTEIAEAVAQQDPWVKRKGRKPKA